MTGPHPPDRRALPWPRILAEGVVIVTSILLAFAIDAWWDGRVDRDREAAYLDMLAADLRETLDNNTRFGTMAEETERALARLVRAYYEPGLPPDDSLARWLLRGTGSFVVQPALGTVQALVSTGDIELLRSRDLRADVPRYLTYMTAFEEFEQAGWERFRASGHDLARHISRESVQRVQWSAAERDSIVAGDEFSTLPAGPLRSLPPPDLKSLVRDPAIHDILIQMNAGKRGMRTYRGLMREQAEQLLELVEAARRS